MYRAKHASNMRTKGWMIGYLVNEDYIAVVTEDGLIYPSTPVRPETIGLCSGRQDIQGKDIFQGDIPENDKGLQFEVCYGLYAMYCPVDNCMMENFGFYTVSEGYYEDMPLGPTEQYARIIGNIYDNPELKVDERYRHGGL